MTVLEFDRPYSATVGPKLKKWEIVYALISVGPAPGDFDDNIGYHKYRTAIEFVTDVPDSALD